MATKQVGAAPSAPEHVATKGYVDTAIDAVEAQIATLVVVNPSSTAGLPNGTLIARTE